ADWVPVSGRGAVLSWAVMHQVYHPGFAADVPYAVVVIELEEGARLVSNLVDCPLDAIAAGMPVEVVFDDVTPDVTRPKFRPAAHGCRPARGETPSIFDRARGFRGGPRHPRALWSRRSRLG